MGGEKDGTDKKVSEQDMRVEQQAKVHCRKGSYVSHNGKRSMCLALGTFVLLLAVLATRQLRLRQQLRVSSGAVGLESHELHLDLLLLGLNLS